MRSVWLCSPNDAIGNVAMMLAAMGDWGTATAWPDLIVAVMMAGIFLTSSVQILRQAWNEYREGGRPFDPTPRDLKGYLKAISFAVAIATQQA